MIRAPAALALARLLMGNVDQTTLDLAASVIMNAVKMDEALTGAVKWKEVPIVAWDNTFKNKEKS